MKKILMTLGIVLFIVLFIVSLGFSKSIAKYGNRIAADFGIAGLWEYDGNNWDQISNDNPDNDGGMLGIGDYLFVDFDVAGIYIYDGNDWEQINVNNPEAMGEFNGNLIADFGSSGIWSYDISGDKWTRISTSNPEGFFYDGTLLWVDFGSGGLYSYDGSGWTQESTGNVEDMIDFYKK